MEMHKFCGFADKGVKIKLKRVQTSNWGCKVTRKAWDRTLVRTAP